MRTEHNYRQQVCSHTHLYGKRRYYRRHICSHTRMPAKGVREAHYIVSTGASKERVHGMEGSNV